MMRIHCIFCKKLYAIQVSDIHVANEFLNITPVMICCIKIWFITNEWHVNTRLKFWQTLVVILSFTNVWRLFKVGRHLFYFCSKSYFFSLKKKWTRKRGFGLVVSSQESFSSWNHLYTLFFISVKTFLRHMFLAFSYVRSTSVPAEFFCFT